MTKWALGLAGWCVLCSVGCRKAEPQVAVPAASVELPEQTPPPVKKTREAEPPPEPEPTLAETRTDEEQPPSRRRARDSGPWGEWTNHLGTRASPKGDDRIWLSEAAEAARAGNANISATEPVEEVTIATGTVEGRVKRVRPGAIEVSDGEGNVYELRIDGRSRGLRRGRHISLQDIAEGTPVQASFDLLGGGESLARDIVLRR